MKKTNVGIITGSLRQKSLSRALGLSLTRLAPENMALSLIEIGDLPHYNQDLEDDAPATYERFRREVSQATAILFVTPEYNRSMPSALKNCLDVGSRPWGKSVWGGKPAAVVSVSPGAMGGFGANHHLRQVLVAVGAAAMPHPEAYVGGASDLFDGEGALVNDKTKDFLTQFMGDFQTWINRLTAASA